MTGLRGDGCSLARSKSSRSKHLGVEGTSHTPSGQADVKSIKLHDLILTPKNPFPSKRETSNLKTSNLSVSSYMYISKLSLL